MRSRRILLRLFPFNQLSFPLLLNAWENEGLDQHFTIEAIRSRESLGDLGPDDVVLYSFMTHHLPIVAEDIRRLKPSGALLIGGGPHISGDPETARAIGLDVVFMGAGEENFVKFARTLLEDGRDNIPGEYRFTGNENIDDTIPVSHHLPTFAPLELTRGCPWDCSYCQVGRSLVQHRSLTSVKRYLSAARNRGVTRIRFIAPSALEYGSDDPSVTCPEKIDELLQLVKDSGFPQIEYGVFPSEIRADTVTTAALTPLINHVTQRRLTISAPSGCNSTLRAIHRGHKLEAIDSALQTVLNSGFQVQLEFTIAYPGETRSERSETLQYIRQLMGNSQIRIRVQHFFPISGCSESWSLPSFLAQDEKDAFQQLHLDGVSAAPWMIGEKIVQDHLNWLKKDLPEFYKRFS